MKNGVSDQRKEQAQMFPSVLKPGLIISWIRYMDMIADLIEFRPSFGELISDIPLMRNVLTGPMTGAMYRLFGQDARPGTRETLMKLNGTHPTMEVNTHIGMALWMFPFTGMLNHANWPVHSTFI